MLFLPQSTSGSSCAKSCPAHTQPARKAAHFKSGKNNLHAWALEASPIARTENQHTHVLPATAHASVLALARQHRPSRRGAQLAPPHDDGRREACRRTARRSCTCHAVGNLGPFKLWRHEAIYERIDRAIGASKRRAHSTTPVHKASKPCSTIYMRMPCSLCVPYQHAITDRSNSLSHAHRVYYLYSKHI